MHCTTRLALPRRCRLRCPAQAARWCGCGISWRCTEGATIINQQRPIHIAVARHKCQGMCSGSAVQLAANHTAKPRLQARSLCCCQGTHNATKAVRVGGEGWYMKGLVHCRIVVLVRRCCYPPAFSNLMLTPCTMPAVARASTSSAVLTLSSANTKMLPVPVHNNNNNNTNNEYTALCALCLRQLTPYPAVLYSSWTLCH